MFVLSYVLPPTEGAAFGKAKVFAGIATKRQAIDRIVNMLESSGVHQDRAQRFGFEMERLDTGSFLALESDGRTFCIDHEDRAPNACPCCGRLVKWGDHAFAGSPDAYCLGCFTWDRNVPGCLPENSAHSVNEES